MSWNPNRPWDFASREPGAYDAQGFPYSNGFESPQARKQREWVENAVAVGIAGAATIGFIALVAKAFRT